jgi:phenylacetate-CoA ligase
MNDTERRYWNPEMETLDRERLEALQLARIRKQLVHVCNRPTIYSLLYRDCGIDPHAIRNMQDFQDRVPLINKAMIRDFMAKTPDPFGGILCVDMEQVRWVGSSSGTSGRPTFSAMNAEDFLIHGEWGARILWQAGVRPGGKAHIAAPPWAKGAQTFQLGAQLIGCAYLGQILFPSEAPRIVLTQKMLQPDTYFVMTTALLSMFNAEIQKQGYSSRDVWSSCKSIMWGGEPLTAVTRNRLEKEWNTDLILFQGPGSDFGLPPLECAEGKAGSHAYEDLYLVETVDPATKKVLPPGQEGELVYTHLLDQATPFVRFNTEDIGVISDEPCVCGRSGRRITLLDRPEFGIMVDNKRVFSIHVREVLECHPETEEGICQLVKYTETMDRLKVRVGYRPEATSDPAELKDRLEKTLSQALDLKTEIELARKSEFETVAHKIVRVLDRTV